MDSVHGHLGPGCRAPRSATATTGRRTSRETGAVVGSDRAHGHLRVIGGNGDLLERAEVTGQPGSDGRTGEATGSTGALGQPVGNGAMVRSRRNWGHPNWTQRSRFPIGTRTEGSGNRVSVKRCQRVRVRATGIGSETRHRPPRHSARRAM
jgi:hypothetical protein